MAAGTSWAIFAAEARRRAEPGPAAPAAPLPVLLHRVARRLALCFIQAAVNVLVKLLDQLTLLTHRTTGPARTEARRRTHTLVDRHGQRVFVERALPRGVGLADKPLGPFGRLFGRKAAILVGVRPFQYPRPEMYRGQIHPDHHRNHREGHQDRLEGRQGQNPAADPFGG